MIKVENLSYSVKGKNLLHNLDLEIQKGKIHFIIGPNGAGKSTFVHLAAGKLEAGSKNIWYEGRRLSEFSANALAQKRAVLSQFTEIAFPIQVLDVVMLGRYPYFTNNPSKEDRDIVEKCIALLDLESFRERNILSLSGGEKQRVHIARVLAQIWKAEKEEQAVLFLDEPLNSLDIYYQIFVLRLLKRLQEEQNLTIVGVVHDLNLAAQYADDLSIFYEGQVVATGLVDEIFTQEHIQLYFRLEGKLLEFEGKKQLLFS
ncbi:MAG: heme ABC transporter ATP-binding protein [Bacteroidetes bacterium]|nr:heme ABC transporter ATP-binding protein [Bacteroidota bacterium]